MDFGIAQISAVTVVCYLAASIVKSSPVNNKWIPAICGGLGGILSVVGFFIVIGANAFVKHLDPEYALF